MAERSNAAVLKTVEVKASGGSNPSPSAIDSKSRIFCPTFTLYCVYLAAVSSTDNIKSAIIIAAFTNSFAWCSAILIRFAPTP